MVLTNPNMKIGSNQPEYAPPVATWAEGQQTAVDSMCRILARIVGRLSQVAEEPTPEAKQVLQ